MVKLRLSTPTESFLVKPPKSMLLVLLPAPWMYQTVNLWRVVIRLLKGAPTAGLESLITEL